MSQFPWNTNNFNITLICVKNGVDVVTFPYYRLMQYLHIVLSVLSIVLILWILAKYRKKIIFHYNIRVLFFSLFVGSLLHATLTIVFNTYQLVLSYTYTSPCDVILPRLFYEYIHIPFIYSVLFIEGTQVIMLVERMIAFHYVRRYERCPNKLGNQLLLFSIMFALFVLIWAYMGEKFDAPQISCITTPVSRTKQINFLFTFLIIIHTVAFCSIFIVYMIHRRRSRLSHNLTSRFQFSENMSSSRLLITLSAFQLVISCAYCATMLYLRTTFDPAKTSMPMFRAEILTGYLIPEYTFLLPLITIIFLKKEKQNRKSDIQNMIKVKAFGNEGWANYSSQLERQWNS